MSQKRVASIAARIKEWVTASIVVIFSFAVSISIASANPTVIGVDGTTVHIPIDIFDGALDVNHGMLKKLPGYDVVTIDYPRSFGLLTLGGPGYDKSVSIGKQNTIKEIKKAQNGDPSVPVKLACYSQGADVCTQVNDELQQSGYDQSSLSYLLLGNVDNAEAGLKVRVPYIGKKGVFIPVAGVTLGNATPTAGSDAQITQLLYEYDFFARAPEYPLNLIADINAIVGAAMEHGAYRWANPYAPSNIVSTTPDGRITNIMIPVNEVPLLTLARFLGMPRVLADIINPTLKAIIDTGYGPVPNGLGTYPTEATPFKLFRSKEKRQEDIVSIQKGIAESKARLAAIFKSYTDKKVPVASTERATIVGIRSQEPLSQKKAAPYIETPAKKGHAIDSVRSERIASRTGLAGARQNSKSNQHNARSAKSPRHIS